MKLTAEDLHAAADVVGGFGDNEAVLGEHGLPWAALQEFIDESDWRDVGPTGPWRDMDPLALAVGISIGVVAAGASRAEPIEERPPPS